MSLGCVYAGQEPVLRNSMSGNVSLVADSFRVIEDIEYTNSNLGDYLLYKADNYVNLEINQDQISDCFLDSFWFSAELEVTGWDAGNRAAASKEYILQFLRENEVDPKKIKEIESRITTNNGGEIKDGSGNNPENRKAEVTVTNADGSPLTPSEGNRIAA